MQITARSTRFDLPEKATVGSAGYDLQADLRGSVQAYDQYNALHFLMPQDNAIRVPAFWRVLIPTALYTETPIGYFWDLRSRSSIPFKRGLILANGVGTIDQDYRGEWLVCFANITAVPVFIQDAEKMGQLVLQREEFFTFVNGEIGTTERGEGGFGSTDKGGRDGK